MTRSRPVGECFMNRRNPSEELGSIFLTPGVYGQTIEANPVTASGQSLTCTVDNRTGF